MQILVTGGAGYVGSVLVHKLVKSNYDVVVIDNLVCGHKNYLPEGIKFYLGDIGDEACLREIFTNNSIVHVIHCAAYTYVGESMTDPIKYYDNNIGKFVKLLGMMKLHECKNIIFSSTCATYGSPETVPLLESNSQNPINVYGWTKLIDEQMLKPVSQIHNFNVVILRYFNVAGAYIDGDLVVGEHHEPETHLIPLAIEAMLNGKEFNLYGTDYDTKDGTAIRDYIHVEDLADAHILALGGSGEYPSGLRLQEYNLGSENGYSVKEIINLVQEIGGKEFMVKNCGRREGDPPVLYANSDKFKNKFGWIQKHDIKAIITSAYCWHKKLMI
jgi:UDP-glucose 4-epimerase